MTIFELVTTWDNLDNNNLQYLWLHTRRMLIGHKKECPAPISVKKLLWISMKWSYQEYIHITKSFMYFLNGFFERHWTVLIFIIVASSGSTKLNVDHFFPREEGDLKVVYIITSVFNIHLYGFFFPYCIRHDFRQPRFGIYFVENTRRVRHPYLHYCESQN